MLFNQIYIFFKTDTSTIEVKLDHFAAVFPTRHTPLSAGLDLYSIDDGRIFPGSRKLINTGISISLPKDTYGQIAPRSSLAVKGIDIGAGIIDADYTGTIKILVINNSKFNFVFNVYDKIAQLIIHKIKFPNPIIVSKLNVTERNDKGFGSSGK